MVVVDGRGFVRDILCVYDRWAGNQMEFCCQAVEYGVSDFSKHDPVWVMEAWEAQV